MVKTRVYGVTHYIGGPNDHMKVWPILEEKVKRGVKVGLEISPDYLNDIRRGNVPVLPNAISGFFIGLTRMIERQGGEVIPIDSRTGCRISLKHDLERGTYPDYPSSDPELAEKEKQAYKGFLKTSVLRSKFMLKKIVEHEPDYAIVGAFHATDFKKFGSHVIKEDQIEFLSESEDEDLKHLTNKEIAELAKRFKTIKSKKS